MSRLEVGKMYTTKHGERIGPMKYEDDGLDYPFYAEDEDGKSTAYTPEGRYYAGGEESPNDIVFPDAKWVVKLGRMILETFESEDIAKQTCLILRTLRESGLEYSVSEVEV